MCKGEWNPGSKPSNSKPQKTNRQPQTPQVQNKHPGVSLWLSGVIEQARWQNDRIAEHFHDFWEYVLFGSSIFQFSRICSYFDRFYHFSRWWVRLWCCSRLRNDRTHPPVPPNPEIVLSVLLLFPYVRILRIFCGFSAFSGSCQDTVARIAVWDAKWTSSSLRGPSSALTEHIHRCFPRLWLSNGVTPPPMLVLSSIRPQREYVWRLL